VFNSVVSVKEEPFQVSTVVPGPFDVPALIESVDVPADAASPPPVLTSATSVHEDPFPNFDVS